MLKKARFPKQLTADLGLEDLGFRALGSFGFEDFGVYLNPA